MGNYKPYPFKIPFTRPITKPFKRPFDVPDDCVLCLVPEIRHKWFDQSINGFDGTITGCTKVDGRFGMGLKILSAVDNVIIPSINTAGKIDETQGSLNMWVKHLEDEAGLKWLWMMGGYKFSMYLRDNNFGIVWSDSTGMSGAGADHTLEYALATGTWNLCTFCWDSGKYWLYLNAVELETTDGCVFSAMGIGTEKIGWDGGGGTIKAVFDEVEIFNRALTAEEVLRVYNAGKPE